jgi:SAM-dependent methyltransferase
MPALESSGTEAINETLQATWRSFHMLEEGLIHRQLHRFSETLTRCRGALTGEEWKACVDFLVRKHPVTDGFFQDPFTRRSFTKPRGYPGDAVLMDLIYHHDSTRATLNQTTSLGQLLYRFTSQRESPQAVCARRDLLAAEIDRVASQCPRPAHVLALACGHLREAQLSNAVRAGALGRFVALDQDAASIAVVQREQAASGIQAIVAPIRSLLAEPKRQALGTFDFVYAAGLFDYLSDRLAKRLVSAMFRLLNPGGRLWVSNFLPEIPDLGYMEALMDWWLIYRDAGQMEALIEEIPGPQIDAHRIFTEPHRNVVFLEVVRHA